MPSAFHHQTKMVFAFATAARAAWRAGPLLLSAKRESEALRERAPLRVTL